MKKLKIIYEDKYLIVVDKPPKLLTIASETEKENTLYHEVSLYLKRKNKNNKVYIVHRLDRDTSGLIIFAKDLKTKRMLQDNWNDVLRYYMAVVEGNVHDKEKTIKSYITENKIHHSYSTDKKHGELAITSYKVLAYNGKNTLIDIQILTGKKNQIRVHMSEANHPIVGDKKYGAKTNIYNRLALHAYKLKFVHPITREELDLNSNNTFDFKK